MQFDVHVYFHNADDSAILTRLQALTHSIDQLKQEISTMSVTVQEALDTLTAQVTQETTVNQSAITLINGFPALIAAAVAAAQAAGATPAQLAAFDTLSTTITQNATDLAAAVTAGTPAAASRR